MSESLSELIEEFTTLKRLRFEGDRGVENLEKLAKAIGYKGHPHRYGSPLEAFLSDNPGAQEALVNWIGEQDITDWKECLESELPEKDGDEDDDDSDEDEEDEEE